MIPILIPFDPDAFVGAPVWLVITLWVIVGAVLLWTVLSSISVLWGILPEEWFDPTGGKIWPWNWFRK
jgi:hypothetical protein